jgi:uncharacterized protein YjbI with pentapeptide repeats
VQTNIQSIGQALENALEEVQLCKSSMWLKKDGKFYEAQITHKRHVDFNGQWRGNRPFTHVNLKSVQSHETMHRCCPICPSGIPSAFEKLKDLMSSSEPIMESLVVTAFVPDPLLILSGEEEQPSLDNSNEIYRLFCGVWCAMLGVKAPSAISIKNVDPLKFREDLIKIPLLALLDDAKSGVAKWNAQPIVVRSYPRFEDSDFNNKNLREINMSFLKFKRSKFDYTDLSTANLNSADFSETTFVSANLEKATMVGVKAVAANFTAARLNGAELKEADLQQAVFTDADFNKANLRKANLRGADLSACKNLLLAKFKGAVYDETTILPSNFPHSADLKWEGRGPDPYKKSQKQITYDHGPVDFDGLIASLEKNFDKERLKKSLAMLKKEKFQLFFEISEDLVFGIVRSQTDKELVYACRLFADGTYACCTQNLNACGGLRGALCKHLLVLTIGLAKADQLSTSSANLWVLASTVEKPDLDREFMTEIFLKYKGAESGEIDWRPTETIPEDYYAF